MKLCKMKMTIFLLILAMRSAAQENHTFTSVYEIQADSISIYTLEKTECNYEGNELHWSSDYTSEKIIKKAIFQYPFLMIYFPTDLNLSTVVVHNTILLQNKSDQFLLLPGEYRIHKNDFCNYIKCKADFNAAYDSIPELSAHVCFRPW